MRTWAIEGRKKEAGVVRCWYWIQGLLGVVLILSPYIGRFADDRPALYTDVIVGVLLVIVALAGFLSTAGRPARIAAPRV
jgi:hypothetical protein